VAKLQQFLDIFKRHPDVKYRPSHVQAKKLIEQVTEDFLGPGFEHIDIRPHLNLSTTQHPNPIVVSVRKNPMDLLQDLISKCPKNESDRVWFSKFAAPLVNSTGTRVYNEFWTGKKWERADALESNTTCAKYPIVWLVLWSDKVSFDRMNRSKGHPLSLSVGECGVPCG